MAAYPHLDEPTAYLLAAQHAQYAVAAAALMMYQPLGCIDVDSMAAAYMSSLAPQTMLETMAADQAPCSRHGKLRSRACMEDDGRGGLQCSYQTECKTRSDLPSQPLGGTMNCSFHGKPRSMNHLTEDGVGGYRCVEDNECKGVNFRSYN